MNALDYQTRLAANVSAAAKVWKQEGTGGLLTAVADAAFIPAIDRRSPAPRGRIVNVKTGACRVALPGELSAWCRDKARGVQWGYATLWAALQRTPWRGGQAR